MSKAPINNIENSINYIELPLTDPHATEKFYNTVFGWVFTHWGDNYLSFTGAVVEGGFNRESGINPGKPGPLIILYSDNLEKKVSEIQNAGGKIIQEIYPFPGGRRFHFEDPNGNELAIWTPAEIE